MPKVTISKLKSRKVAKDHKSVAPIHKPAGKHKPASVNIQKPNYAK